MTDARNELRDLRENPYEQNQQVSQFIALGNAGSRGGARNRDASRTTRAPTAAAGAATAPTAAAGAATASTAAAGAATAVASTAATGDGGGSTPAPVAHGNSVTPV